MTKTTETDTRHMIRAAMAYVPYSGSLSLPGSYRDPLTDDEIRAWLISLAAILRDVAKRHESMDTELRELRAQRDAMRAFLGTERKDH